MVVISVFIISPLKGRPALREARGNSRTDNSVPAMTVTASKGSDVPSKGVHKVTVTEDNKFQESGQSAREEKPQDCLSDTID